MTTDERIDKLTDRIDALTQSVELLASMHKDNEKRLARMETALTAAAAAFLQAWTRKDSNGDEA
jgi:chaperonin cofactor prefoldin